MNRVLLYSTEVLPTGEVVLGDFRADHIRRVLRAEPGKRLRIGLLNGPCGIGTILQVTEDGVRFVCEFEDEPPARPAIDLLLAMPRPKVLKRLWSQFAALGIGQIILTGAEKVERYYFDTHILTPEFYTPRLIEGLQQAGDTLLPEVTECRSLSDLLENNLDRLFPRSGKKLLAEPSSDRSVFQTLESSTPTSDRILLAIGPEGGWTGSELDMFRGHGFQLFGLGSRILRTDTACIALISMLAEARRLGV